MHTNEAINAFIRETIAENHSKLVSVEALAKTGEIKKFVFSDASRRTHISEVANVAAIEAAETRKRNNPDLFNIWDMVQKRWRCFDVNSVLTIKAQGTEHVLRVHRPRVYA